MLDCIKKLLKRGKRKQNQKPKNSPWSLPQPGLFNSYHDPIKGYYIDTATIVLKNKVKGTGHNKFPK